jgi:flagellar basal body P-ring protein FlgI
MSHLGPRIEDTLITPFLFRPYPAERVQGSMRRFQIWTIVALSALLCGCSWFGNKNVRSQSPDTKDEQKKKRLIADYAVPYGLYPVRIESIGFVSGLNGTGSDPSPSYQRTELIDEMRRRGITNPSKILATNNFSLVLVRGVLRPGIQKGEKFDVEFRVPAASETTSLRGGHLLQARLREIGAMGDGRFHEGSVLATAEGPLLVDPSADPKKDRTKATYGRVLGAGVALKSRPLGLVLKPGLQTISNSSKIQNAINKRFAKYENGIKIGVAKAQTEQYVKIEVHPRYKDNINRYLQVMRSITINETDTERIERMARLEKEIMNRDTAADAALQLEAMNKEGIPHLKNALASNDPEVRFYAAEALAYLDQHEAVTPLAQAAREEPAFRVFALTALSSMQDPTAFEQLQGMLSMTSAETRYGAFRALWTMNENDPFVRGEVFGDDFHYHVLDVSGPAMVHVTHSRLSELVLFGKDQEFQLPLMACAGNQIIVRSNDEGEVVISKFVPNEADQKRTVSPKIDDVVRAIVELGGTYPDVVQVLQEAKTTGSLASRFEVDALPQAGRVLERDEGEEIAKSGGKAAESTKILTSPLPWLFESKDAPISYKEGKTSKKDSTSEGEETAKKEEKKTFLGKMKWWDSKKEKPETDANS